MSWDDCEGCIPGLHKSIPQTDANRTSFVRKMWCYFGHLHPKQSSVPALGAVGLAGAAPRLVPSRGHARRVQEIARVTGFDSHGYQLSAELMPSFPSLSSTPGELS